VLQPQLGTLQKADEAAWRCVYRKGGLIVGGILGVEYWVPRVALHRHRVLDSAGLARGCAWDRRVVVKWWSKPCPAFHATAGNQANSVATTVLQPIFIAMSREHASSSNLCVIYNLQAGG
jgi:hypothetical protein